MKNGVTDMEEQALRNTRAKYFRQEYFDPDKTQCEMALEYMRKFDSITPLEALTAFGCFRLPARISDLKARGYNISMERDKKGKHYGIYRLETEEFVK